MPQFIAVDHAACTGCRECEVVCSLYHFGECNPERSAIRVIRREKDGLVEPLPLVCQQCEQAPCMEACPTKAIFREGDGDVLTIDPEKCSGCGECTEACPAGLIFMDKQRDVAICCDLCGGDPQCAVLCHSRCLTLAKEDGAGSRDRVYGLAKIREKVMEGNGRRSNP